jgi:ELWxxDGT repeat protein
VHGRELWVTDGTTAGTHLVCDIEPGGGSSDPQDFVNVNGTLYFTATTTADGDQVWKSDGTANGTILVSDPNKGPSISDPLGLTAVGGNLFFDAYDSTNGYSLWMVPSGTVPSGMVMPVSPALTMPGKAPVQPELVSNRTLAINRDLEPILSEARNSYPSEPSSVSALWQQAATLDLQRLDALLSWEAGAMGVTKDALIHDLVLASKLSPSSV